MVHHEAYLTPEAAIAQAMKLQRRYQEQPAGRAYIVTAAGSLGRFTYYTPEVPRARA